MPSLLDLTSQGDVGTISDESKLSSVTLMTPQQLYELWERQNWQSHTIDFTQDRRDWEAMDDDLRRRLAWNLSSFFIGEERVTTQFSGLVMAYESQSEEAFLTTQQVDEARHAQHFNRFYEQVLGHRRHVRGSHAPGPRGPQPGVHRDVRRGARRLGPAPGGEPARHRGQGRLRDALPHDHRGHARADRPVVPDRLHGTQARSCPGWVEGFKLISQDEHRHVAYGTWFLREKASDPALRQRIAARIAELIPLAAAVLVPTGEDPDDYAILDYSMEETNTFAFNALNRRLKVIGIDLASLAAAAA